MKPIVRAASSAFFVGLPIAVLATARLNAGVAQAPPPPGVVTQVSQQILNQLNAAGQSTPQRSTFRLIAPPSVEAGQVIKVEIVRETGEGGDYSFRLNFDPQGLVQNPPHEAVLANGAANWSESVATSPDIEGSPTLHIYFAPEKGAPGISGPRSVDVAITPKPQPPSYDAAAPTGEIARGNDFQFTVVRKGGSGASQIHYQVSQDGNVIQSGALDFNDNALTQPVPVTGYDTCGTAPSLQLLDVAGNTTAAANLSPQRPDSCDYIPRETNPQPWWWPWVLIPIVLICGWTLWRILRRRRLRRRTVVPGPGGARNPGPATDLACAFDIKGGKTRFPNGEPQLRPPPIETPPPGDAS